MNLLVYYAILFSIFATTLFLGIYFKKKGEKKYSTILKILSLTLAAIFAVRYMWGYDLIKDSFNLFSLCFDTKTGTFFGLITVWFSYSSVLLLCVYSFFRGKFSTNLVKFYALPLSLFCTVCLNFNIIAINGQSAMSVISIRPILMAVEQGLAFGLALSTLINETNWKKLFSKEKQEKTSTIYNTKAPSFLIKTWNFIKKAWFPTLCVFALLLSVMPSYIFQGLFGNAHQTQTITDFKLPHRIILYIAIILPIIIHKSLSSKDFQTKKFLILIICLGTLISYSLYKKADAFADPTQWPLHLCNTAMYIMPIVLIFNLKKFFYFTYFINVFGALLAMLMPNYSSSVNMFDSSLVSFYINHYIAFFMPILFVSLKLFKRPTIKEYLYSSIGFAVYFVLVIGINSLFSGLYEVGLASRGTDFFFVNSDFVAAKLGKWAENLRNTTLSFYVSGIRLTFYPIYQSLFLLVYLLLGFGVWFVYSYCYQIRDFYVVLAEKNKKIKLDEIALCTKYNKKELNDCMNEKSVNKLVINNASKCYGNNKTYSLKNASFEVKAGEILGFLGPNGAGKSTLIKCIVGMQPLTDGSIEINGFDIEKQPVLAKEQLGFVPDHYALYEKLTGREYVNYIADLYNVSKKDRDERLERLLDLLNMKDFFDNQIRTYSHGMKQKIAIISALVHNPKLWILDEPLTGLDPTSIHQVKQCMIEHAKNGNIVFFSSHIIDIVEKLCDRIIIIKNGEIKTETKLSSLKKKGIELEQFYLESIGVSSEEKTKIKKEKSKKKNLQ